MKKDKKYILVYIFLIVGIGIIFLSSDYLFGSRIDWINQHVSFAEYFRNQFYETKNIFPNFSFNIGAGQNIFNFSYYGLYNPIILLSYFLPFIEMKYYIIIAMLIITLISTIMIYYFLKDKVSANIAFVSGLLYLLSSPILFNAHRHIMFVSYMPFLIMGLFGIDQYKHDNKNILLIILSIFLMIMTSYYYSIGGIIVLLTYYFYTTKFNKKNTLKLFTIILLAILLTSFYLFPTAYALVTGRIQSIKNTEILKLLIPNINLGEVMYSYYSLGLTSIYLFTVIYFAISKNKKTKLLGIFMIILSFIPLSSYILNGFLYARTKVLIAFLPLAIYMISLFIKDVINKKVNLKQLITIIIILNIILLICGYTQIIYYIDSFITILSLLLYYKFNKKYLFIVPLLLISLTNCIFANLSESYLPKDYNKINFKVKDYYRTNNLVNTLIQANDGTNYTTSIYSSVYNPNYYDLYYNVFDNAFAHRNKLMTMNSHNLLFQKFMGVKYIVTTKDNLIGYHKIASKDKYNLLQNNDVFSIGYGSNNLMSYDEYNKLTYPYNIEALLHYIVTPNGNNTLNTNIEKYKPNFTYETKKLQIKKDDVYKIKSNNGKLKIHLNETLQNKILLIDFKMNKEQSCDITGKKNDQSITINGISNKLTCKEWEYKNNNYHFTYVISENTLDTLNIYFSKGYYEISDINMYILDYNTIKDIKHYDLAIDYMKDDTLKGHIDMQEDGYFVLSIPYDEGFQITVDGKKVNYEKVNVDLIGFKMDKGKHKVVVKYKAPFFTIGKLISLFTLIIVLVVIYQNKKCKVTNN